MGNYLCGVQRTDPDPDLYVTVTFGNRNNCWSFNPVIGYNKFKEDALRVAGLTEADWTTRQYNLILNCELDLF